jgi:HTH-type transcriptional regulator/antitoxin HipB
MNEEGLTMNIETANRLLQFRKKHNLSQEELASKIGVSRQAVSKWERAEASPDSDNLVLLAEIYGVSLDELLKGVSDTENDMTDESNANDSNANSNNTTNNDTDNNNDNGYDYTEYKSGDRVSFKNGLHIDSNNGDRVHISFKDGIQVEDKSGTYVNVGRDGVFVNENGKQRVYTDKDGHIISDSDMPSYGSKDKFWNKFPFFIIAIIAFMCWGLSGKCFGWALSWVCFLTIPIYHSLVDAIYKRNPSHFAYPVVTVIVYMFFGFFGVCGGWAYGWMVFLTIPIYYWFCSLFHK